jgi:hypothetical protein
MWFNTSLLSGPIKCSRFILHIPCSAMESAIPPRSPGYWKVLLETVSECQVCSVYSL